MFVVEVEVEAEAEVVAPPSCTAWSRAEVEAVAPPLCTEWSLAEVEVEAGAAGEEADGQMETATTPMLSRTEGTERWRNVWDCDRTDTRVACSMHALCFVVHSVRLPPGFCIMCIHNV